MKTLLRIKSLWFFALLTVLSIGNLHAQVTLPHLDAINYTAGQSLQTQSGWTALTGTDDLLITSGSLSYSGLEASSGNKLSFDGAGMDATKLFTQQGVGTTTYYSFLLNVSALGSLNATGGYFIGFAESTASTTYGGTVWLKADGVGYDIGLNTRTTVANTVWTSGTTAINTTVLVVVSYQVVSGTGNDIVRLWINPTPGVAEPAATLTATNTGGTDLANVNRILIRQDSTTTTPFVQMDEIRIGTDWASVTPSAAPATTGVSVTSLTDFGSVNTGSSSASQNFTVEGTNLTTDIVVAAPTNFEVSLDDTNWFPSVNLTPSSGTVVTTTVYARFTPLSGGVKSGNITVTSAPASQKTVSVSGTGVSPISNTSDIIENAGFVYPTNIDYSTYQAADITDLNSIDVAHFTIRDGGAAAPDADSFGTELTSVTFSLANFANIRRVALYDGTTELGEVAAAASITFPVSLTAADDSTKDFSLRVTFNSTVTDNHQFVFKITDAVANVATSTFAATDAGGAETNNTDDDNKIEVTGTQLVFITNTTNGSVNVPMTPSPVVRVIDANNNRDLDSTASIDITSTGTLAVTPTTVVATSGSATFSALTHTAAGLGLQLTASSAGLGNVSSNTFDIYNPIFANPITGTNPNSSNPYTTGQTVDPNITVSGIGRGTGIVGTNANDRYNANTWNSPSFDANKYFTFTLTPNPGKEIDFVNLIYTAQISTALTGYEIRSSVDGFTATIGSPTAASSPGANNVIDLSAPQFQNLANSIEFRIYAWGAASSTSTFSINNFSFNGDVNNSTAPNITASVTDLTQLDYFIGNGPSASQSFTVNAANLNPADGDITVSLTGDFEVSTDDINFGSTATISYTGGTVTSLPVYVRLIDGLGLGTHTGTVTVSGGSAPSDSVNVQGIVRVPFDIPYSNTFRTAAANNDAIAQGLVLNNTTFNASYDLISLNGYIETPMIDFTQQTNLEVSFDGATFGGNTNQTLELQISTNGGTDYSTLQSVTYLSSTFLTTRVLIDLAMYQSTTGKLRIRMVSGTNTTRFRDLVIADYTIWDGMAWSNGEPTSTKVAVFEGDYTTSDLLSAKRVIINSGIIAFESGSTLSTQDEINVNGGILNMQSNANLLQANTTFANSGLITVERQVSLRRLDYVYWSSPVSNQLLADFSPDTTPTRFYTLNEPTNAFVAVDPALTTFANGRGYMVRAPNNFTTSLQTFTGVFTGVPHNGTYTTAGTALDASHGNNMLGNPYPSPISIASFKSANPTVGTLYFWTHYSQNGADSNYATYTNTGAAGANGVVPNGTIQIGQGFIAKLSAPATISFTNAMRVDNHANQFFRGTNTTESEPERHRLWLNLANENKNFNQILVGYVEGATNNADFDYDGKAMENPTTMLYSKIDNDSYIVQGKALPFQDTDVVALGFKTAEAGNYTISIDHIDGVFANGQNIYIKDNLTNVVHNVSESAYNFTSLAGTFEDRFEVIYQNVTLGFENPTLDANSIVIFKKDNILNINAGNTLISEVKVFDIQGRLVYQKQVNNVSQVVLNDLKANNQVLMVQVRSNDNKVVTKKVVN